jgi:hypothetical protein
MMIRHLTDAGQEVFLVNCEIRGEYLYFRVGVFDREIKDEKKTFYSDPDPRGHRDEYELELDPLWLNDLPRVKKNKRVKIHGIKHLRKIQDG